jgi:tRNA pseudouridine32 synthase/23S rRNA pseudouridine746 synthase
LFTTRRELRGAYQTLFARGSVQKTYLARAAVNPDLAQPTVVRSRIVKRRGQLQAVEEPGEPNAETFVEHLGVGLYRLTPRTGRTHQLRVHMASIGLPIENDPLYPDVVDVAADDFSRPMQLLAHRLEFRDPVSGNHREFVSRRTVAITVERRAADPLPVRPRRSPRDFVPPLSESRS